MYAHIKYNFDVDSSIDDELTTTTVNAFPYDENGNHIDIGSFGRMMFSLIDDCKERPEDEDGYVLWHGSTESYQWISQELTEEEIDHILINLY